MRSDDGKDHHEDTKGTKGHKDEHREGNGERASDHAVMLFVPPCVRSSFVALRALRVFVVNIPSLVVRTRRVHA